MVAAERVAVAMAVGWMAAESREVVATAEEKAAAMAGADEVVAEKVAVVMVAGGVGWGRMEGRGTKVETLEVAA